MKITSIETFRIPEYGLSLWVKINTDEGIYGLGESTNEPAAIDGAVHSFIAANILGEDAGNIEHIWNKLYDRANYQGCAGAELRALSAVDIALWDILGKVTKRPVYALLGGKVRDSVAVYNTCGNHGGRDIGIYDSRRFIEDAGGLAEDLLSNGINGMKIWPLDPMAQRARGHHITYKEIKKGIEPVRKIREAVGLDMEIMMECHSCWNIPSAIRIAEALEEYNIRWLEDPILVDDPANLAALRRKINVPVLASERLFTRMMYKPLLEQEGVDIVMVDLSWTGGLTEGKKIASMADAYRIPVTTHNCGGPVLTKACAHFNISTVNSVEMETVRAIYKCFPDVTDSVFDIRDGQFYVDDTPGLGVEFKPEVFDRSDIIYRKSEV